jgi:hypothetical protein
MSEKVPPAIYYIPRKTRIKTEFVRGITANDLFWMGTGGALALLIGIGGSDAGAYVLAVAIGLFTAVGIIRDKDGTRVYGKIWLDAWRGVSQHFYRPCAVFGHYRGAHHKLWNLLRRGP